MVEEAPADQERVFFGAYVTVEDDQGRESRYRVVGADEIDPDRGWISMASPMGRALLGKRLDDEFTVRRPAGDAGYIVIAIDYD